MCLGSLLGQPRRPARWMEGCNLCKENSAWRRSERGDHEGSSGDLLGVKQGKFVFVWIYQYFHCLCFLEILR